MIHLVQAEPVINGAVEREGGMVGRFGSAGVLGSLVRWQR